MPEAETASLPTAEVSSTSTPPQAHPRYPSLYQINTRVWLTALSRPLGRQATLDDIPDAELDRWTASSIRLAGVG
jgi:hypothetical protein